jgi:hypothetical protein
MLAYCPHESHSFSVSLYEIEDMSAESHLWIAGYLAGQEPRGEEMYGEVFHDLDPDDLRYQLWLRARALFRITGIWQAGRTCERCGKDLLPSEPLDSVCLACQGTTTVG